MGNVIKFPDKLKPKIFNLVCVSCGTRWLTVAMNKPARPLCAGCSNNPPLAAA